MIKLYTDGSCSPNPGIGGWAACFFKGEELIKVFGYVENTTNNRMEMYSIIQGLEAINKLTNEKEIEVYSDSQYVINTITKNWKRNSNEDLWKIIDFAITNLNIKWFWVKGHSSSVYNNLCDELAVKARENKQIQDYSSLMRDNNNKLDKILKQEFINRNSTIYFNEDSEIISQLNSFIKMKNIIIKLLKDDYEKSLGKSITLNEYVEKARKVLEEGDY